MVSNETHQYCNVSSGNVGRCGGVVGDAAVASIDGDETAIRVVTLPLYLTTLLFGLVGNTLVIYVIARSTVSSLCTLVVTGELRFSFFRTDRSSLTRSLTKQMFSVYHPFISAFFQIFVSAIIIIIIIIIRRQFFSRKFWFYTTW